AADLSGPITSERLAHLRQNGAQAVVTGSYRQTGAALRFEVQLVDTSSGQTLSEVSEMGPPTQLFDVAVRPASQLRPSLGLPELTSTETIHTRNALPTNAEAARLYTDGTTALRRFQPTRARQAFEAALALEPDQPMVWAALASAWHELESE